MANKPKTPKAPEQAVTEKQNTALRGAAEPINAEFTDAERLTNPALLQWPTDQWGVTKDIKSAIVQAVSRMNGAADKKELIDAVLALGIAHVNARFDEQVRVNEARNAAAEQAEA